MKQTHGWINIFTNEEGIKKAELHMFRTERARNHFIKKTKKEYGNKFTVTDCNGENSFDYLLAQGCNSVQLTYHFKIPKDLKAYISKHDVLIEDLKNPFNLLTKMTLDSMDMI